MKKSAKETKMGKKRATPMKEEESSISTPAQQPWPWCRSIVLLVVIVSIFVQSIFMDATNNKQYQDTKYPSVPPLVEIFDNVLPEHTRSAAHSFASSWDMEKDSANYVFRYPRDDGEKNINNLLETILDNVVQELYPGKEHQFYVEYWARQKWFHTIPHADIDEGKHKESSLNHDGDEIRYPEWGHVLYLTIGSDVQGPTVAFLNHTKGGDLLVAGNNNDDKEMKPIDMVVCPAVESRLFRFKGHLLHAVPRPSNIWFARRNFDLVHEPKHVYQRSVLLFNLWPYKDGPPRDLIYPTNNDRMVLTSNNDDDGRKKTSATIMEDKVSLGSCHSKHEWKPVPLEPIVSSTFSFQQLQRRIFELPLLGNAWRRGTEQYSVQLEASSSDAIMEALADATVPHAVTLHRRFSSILSYLL